MFDVSLRTVGIKNIQFLVTGKLISKWLDLLYSTIILKRHHLSQPKSQTLCYFFLGFVHFPGRAFTWEFSTLWHMTSTHLLGGTSTHVKKRLGCILNGPDGWIAAYYFCQVYSHVHVRTSKADLNARKRT